jgi:hypothetical protein
MTSVRSIGNDTKADPKGNALYDHVLELSEDSQSLRSTSLQGALGV